MDASHQHLADMSDANLMLAELIDQLAELVEGGDAAGVEALIEAYPEHADRLRRAALAVTSLAALSDLPSEPLTSAGDEVVPLGRKTLGDFRIVREIGRGGMGVVYEAIQLSLDRRVALKVLPCAALLDARQLQRFLNEARVAASLHHTHIVPIYTVGSERGVYFYAMQYIAGQDLADVIVSQRAALGQQPPSDPQEQIAASAPTVREAQALIDTRPAVGTDERFRQAAAWAADAAEALHYAHSIGVVHRDIKPANLLVDEAGAIWISDFGLARLQAEGNLSGAGDVLGTLRYMSPEQARGDRMAVDARTDVYSLGVTLYELLTLTSPFVACRHAQLIAEIADRELRPVRRFDARIPADLEAIVCKATEKDTSDRYPSAAALALDLRNFLAHRPIAARRPSLVQRLRKWGRRHRATVGLAAVATILLAIGGVAASALTLSAYRAEARQRAAAEAHLEIAARSIDRLLSRVADDRYYHGDLDHAAALAVDATEFYEELLARSDDPELQFRTAEAHGSAAHIWGLVGRHEKAAEANRRAGELLLRLTTSHPDRLEYLAALADNYNRVGLVNWALDRPAAAEPSWRQSWEIWTELAERRPTEPTHHQGVSNLLANLGCVCCFTDRFAEAEEYFRRSEAIAVRLPPELRNSAGGLASQAGSITNQAELARLRGQYDRALELLAASVPLHKQSLEKWPANPVARDCYYHTLWSIAECQLGAGRAAKAAQAVESYLAEFPDRLDAYGRAAEQLFRCAAIASAEIEDPGTAFTAIAHALSTRASELLETALSDGRSNDFGADRPTTSANVTD